MEKTVAYTWNRKPINGVARKPYIGVLITDITELKRLTELRSEYGSTRDVARQCQIVAELLSAFKLTGQVDNRKQAQTPISEFLQRSWRFSVIHNKGYKTGDYVVCHREFMRIEKISNTFWLVLKDGSGKTHANVNPSSVSRPK